MKLATALSLLAAAQAAHAGPVGLASRLFGRKNPLEKNPAMDGNAVMKEGQSLGPIFETLTGTTLTIPSSLLAPPGVGGETTTKEASPTSLELIPIDDFTTTSASSATSRYDQPVLTTTSELLPTEKPTEASTSQSTNSETNPFKPKYPTTIITTEISPVKPSSTKAEESSSTEQASSSAEEITTIASTSEETTTVTQTSDKTVVTTDEAAITASVTTTKQEIIITTSIVPGKPASGEGSSTTNTRPAEPETTEASAGVTITSSISPECTTSKDDTTTTEAEASTSKAEPKPTQSESDEAPVAPVITTAIVPSKPSDDAPATSVSVGESDSQPAAKPTEKPDANLPTGITSGIPTGTTTVGQQVYASNLARARDLNKAYAELTPSSPCSSGQVACIKDKIGYCSKDGAFDMRTCNGSEKCFALPLTNSEGVVLKCMDAGKAKEILKGSEGGDKTTVTKTAKPTYPGVVTMTTVVTVTDAATTTTTQESKPTSLEVIPIDDVSELAPIAVTSTVGAHSTIIAVVDGVSTFSLYFTETVTETEKETVTVTARG
jgi:hypothetical protein